MNIKLRHLLADPTNTLQMGKARITRGGQEIFHECRFLLVLSNRGIKSGPETRLAHLFRQDRPIRRVFC